MEMSGSLTCVVVAVDGSEVSMEALRWALDNLKLSSPSPDSSFVVLHVQPSPSVAAGVSPGTIPFGGPSGLEVPAFTSAIEQHQKRITDTIMDHARLIFADRPVNVKTQVVVGDPKYKICETVENLHADLLVIGSRAHGRIKRMFLGSVSNYCTNHVHCPVVVIKPKGDSSE
ncbi:Adenine nucleotide alpha hydrolases-like superfamily protein [Raphanus sativus]|uniref:Universal stress protein PHOS34 n=1 Tax=Raphanus sativus TaxID=3726 RepID=A0A9W3DSE2_RAPSA|nr:universal stress protein PHOS34 [Raphanus sativus]KAJ4914960.1 Adenine nucleotide alpha hydrolases-like superfamily protein [Raphanus sativus]